MLALCGETRITPLCSAPKIKTLSAGPVSDRHHPLKIWGDENGLVGTELTNAPKMCYHRGVEIQHHQLQEVPNRGIVIAKREQTHVIAVRRPTLRAETDGWAIYTIGDGSRYGWLRSTEDWEYQLVTNPPTPHEILINNLRQGTVWVVQYKTRQL